MNQNSFWHEELDCPVVYVAGTCVTSEDQSIAATYGLCWGFKNPKNKSGVVKVEPNELRALLGGLVRVLKIAIIEKVQKLVICINSDKLNAELESWEKAHREDKLTFENSDYLAKIDILKEKASEYMYWLADAASNQQNQGFKWAHHYATLKASGRFDAKKPPPPPTTVAIFGACSQEGQKNSKASFSVFWGEGDTRNGRGLVTGKQSHLRAEYWALRHALRAALLANITNLHVLTRNPDIKNKIDAFHEAKKKPLDSLGIECKELAEKLSKLTVEHIAAPAASWELDEAKAMAKQEQGEDCNSNIEEFSDSLMDKLDQIILTSDPYEEDFEVTVRPPKCSKKNKELEKSMKKKHPSKAENSSSSNTTYKQTETGSIEISAYQEMLGQQRPLRTTGYMRADGVEVFLGRC